MRRKRTTLVLESLEERCLLSICDDGMHGVSVPIAGGSLTSPLVLPGDVSTPYCYHLENDISASGTALVVGNPNITLDLNGKNISYGNHGTITVPNGDFETGTVDSPPPGWDSTYAPLARLALTDGLRQTFGPYAMHGSKMVQFTNFSTPQTLLSSAINLPNLPNNQAYSYAATVMLKSLTRYDGVDGGRDASVEVDVWDSHDLMHRISSDISNNAFEGYSPVAKFNSTGMPNQQIYLGLVVTPACSVRYEVPCADAHFIPTTLDLDWADVKFGGDYGVLATRSYADGLPIQLRNLPGDNYQHQANFTLVNTDPQGRGQISQGNSAGYASAPVNLWEIPGFTVRGVSAAVNGMDTQNIFADGTKNGSIDSCYLTGAQERISNRQHVIAAISLEQAEESESVTNNTIDGTSHVGIFYAWDGVGTPSLSILSNMITQNSYVTDAYGISIVGAQNFEIAGNTIAPTDGRGILFDGWNNRVQYTNNGSVHDNTVYAQEGPNLEYDYRGLQATALRIREREGHDILGNLAIFNNTFVAWTSAGADSAAMAARISKTSAGLGPVVIRNNIFVAYVLTTNAGATDWNTSSLYNATAVSMSGTESNIGLEVTYNLMESDDTALNFGDNDNSPGNHMYGTYLMGNTLLWDSDPTIVNFGGPSDANPGGYRDITGGYTGTDVRYNRILNSVTPSDPRDGSATLQIFPTRHDPGCRGDRCGAVVNNTITWQTPPEVDGMDNLVVFGISADNNQVLYETQSRSGQWGPWAATAPGQFKAIAGMMDAMGLPMLAAIGMDNQVYYLTSSWDSQLGLQWGAWTLTNSGASAGIAAVTDNNGNQNIYSIQPDHNNWVYSETFANGQWGPWILTRALNVQNIAATTDATGYAEIFGRDQSNYVEVEKFGPSIWGPWALTSTFRTVKAISAVTDATGKVWVFGTGTNDDDVYYEYYNGVSWADWQITVSTAYRWGPISAGLDLNGNRVIFGRRNDGQIQEETLSGSQWSWFPTSYWAAGFLAVR